MSVEVEVLSTISKGFVIQERCGEIWEDILDIDLDDDTAADKRIYYIRKKNPDLTFRLIKRTTEERVIG